MSGTFLLYLISIFNQLNDRQILSKNLLCGNSRIGRHQAIGIRVRVVWKLGKIAQAHLSPRREKQRQLSPHRHRKSCNSADGKAGETFPVNTLNSKLGLVGVERRRKAWQAFNWFVVVAVTVTTTTCNCLGFHLDFDLELGFRSWKCDLETGSRISHKCAACNVEEFAVQFSACHLNVSGPPNVKLLPNH